MDDAELAVLVACHRRGPLTLDEIGRLLGSTVDFGPTLSALVSRGQLGREGSRYAVTLHGRLFLDDVLEGIEGQLTPDAPEYVRRYRREAPTLPFDANTVWAEAICANLRVEPEALRPLVPSMFELDLHEGHAYVSLTASRLKEFGVGWLPAALRMNFYQATYRAHVTYTDFRGRTTRGCFFVRSETNSAVMSLAANLLPEFRAHHCSTHPILMARRDGHLVLTVDSAPDPAGKIVLVLDLGRLHAEMPAGSAFRSLGDAYDFLVDFHDAFSHDPETGEVFFLRIERGEWKVKVVEPVDYYLGFLEDGPFPRGSAVLDSVFYFQNVPYRWLPLLKERVKHRA